MLRNVNSENRLNEIEIIKMCGNTNRFKRLRLFRKH